MAYVGAIARSDPVLAWQLWSQYQLNSRLDDIVLLLGANTVVVLVGFLILIFRG